MRVLITGTSSGIGKAIAEKFLKEGFDVTGFDRKEASISQDSYTHFCLDIRAREQYPALAPFDIVINNAGVQNEDDIDINLKGTIAITEAYGIHDNIRAVLMIGSASGHTGAEFPEYTASKGGVLAYTKNVALRIAPYGGTCNSLDFGGVLTELNRKSYKSMCFYVDLSRQISYYWHRAELLSWSLPYNFLLTTSLFQTL